MGEPGILHIHWSLVVTRQGEKDGKQAGVSGNDVLELMRFIEAYRCLPGFCYAHHVTTDCIRSYSLFNGILQMQQLHTHNEYFDNHIICLLGSP